MNSNLPQGGRLRGRLVGDRLNDKGFGFLSTGKGQPQYFILRHLLPPEAWVKGALIEFTPAPPRRGTHAPRAGDPRPVDEPAEAEESL